MVGRAADATRCRGRLLPGYRWHRTARIWRTPVLGELAMGTTNGFTLRLASRESNVTPGPMPDAWLRSVLDHLDQNRFPLRLIDKLPFAGLRAMGQRSQYSKRSEDTGIRIGIGNPDFARIAARIASAEKKTRQRRGWRTIANKAFEWSGLTKC